MSGTLAPAGKFLGLSDTGVPLNGGLLYTYAAGTSTPATTYNDVDLAPAHANANPVVLDSAGRATVYLDATSYKFVLKTAAGVTVWSQDNIPSTGLNTAAIGSELVTLGGTPDTPIVATSYPSGTTFDKVHAGTMLWSFDSANLTGTYVLEGMLLGNGGTVTAALVNLSDGAPDTALVTIASSSTTGERQASSAITFAAGGAAKVYAIKVKVSAGSGRAWMLRIVRTA